MNIKNKTLLWLAAASMALTACSDWTDTEINPSLIPTFA